MSFWKDKNCFVTGATGFVGAHVVRELIERQANVICLQRDPAKVNALDLFDLRARVTVVNGHLGDLALMERLIKQYEVEAVFHLAAQALVDVAYSSPLSTFETNIRGTYSLLEACRLGESVKRIVVASSDNAYGPQDSPPFTEDHPLNGLLPYDASKTCADIISRSFARAYDMPVAVTRITNIYGPGDMNVSRIVPGTIVSVLRNENPVIRSDGRPLRDFVYVDDVSRAYLLLAENIEKARGEAFNFGSGSPVQLLELVKKIIHLSGKDGKLFPDVLQKTAGQGTNDERYLDHEKASRVLGWDAQFDLDDGLSHTIKWYAHNLSSFI